MSDSGCIVIIGAGLAGDTAGAELRAAGWAGHIVLIADDGERPYDRPPLSKAVLLSETAEPKIFFRAPSWYDENRIELRLDDPAASIDTQAHQVTLASGARVDYTKLLIATGARARKLPLLDAHDVPVHYLRSLADAQHLRAGLVPDANVVVIGGGVIGLEVAATAVQRGCKVTVIEGLERIMARSVSKRVSDYIFDYHHGKGAKIFCGVKLASVQDQAGVILLEDGTRLEADLVVVGIGAVPNTELAEAGGIIVRDGIVVDRFTRTNVPDVFAAGDVTRFEHGEIFARAEHWRHAIDQATVAAQVMAGKETPYHEQAWLWTDQYDLNVQVTGSGQGDTEVLRGDVAKHAFTVFQLRAGHIVGAISVNQAKFKRAIAALVYGQAEIDPAVLADETVDLKMLAATLPKAA
jgi:3-phenylpropionate/trans-cinnamate dioxygenase ferredoxin reductase subunit